MQRHRWNLVAWLAICCSVWACGSWTTASAGERHIDFLNGLRSRDYFDTALEYLEKIDQQPGLDPAMKVLIPFEKATTLIQQAKITRHPDTANQILDRSAAFLEEFLKANPEHPLAARANAEAASVLLNKGKVGIIQAKNPANAQKKGELLKQSQANFTQAKGMFDKAYDQHYSAWKKFKPFIEKAAEPELFAQREEAELAYIRARLDAAIVLYEASQAYERDTPEFKAALLEASQKFAELTTQHRTQVAGLMAQMYTAKCFEELGDLQKALGIYNDLLRNPGDSPTMRNLQSQVTHFKLICLNSDKKSDYKLVDQLASEWIKANAPLVRSRPGVGIRYEQARALEMLGKDRTTPDPEKKAYLTAALDTARQVNRYGGEFRDLSQSMIQRLNAALNRDGTDPKDFDTAYGMARELVGKISEFSAKVKGAGADKPAVEKAQRELDLHLAETARILNLALALRKPANKMLEVNYARYALSHVYYLQKRYYESAVMGEFIARRYSKDEDSGAVPLDSAYLAMAAYNGAYRLKENRDKEADIRRMIDICNYIATNWPDSPKAVEAYMMLGGLYRVTGQPAEAAVWFSKVPEASGQYLTAQIDAGQAYWGAYLEALTRPEGQRPDTAALTTMQTQAQTILKNAIGTLEAKLGEAEVLPENIAFAKLTLAQMANATGQYAEAIKLLETDKRAVLTVTAVKEGEARPKVGISSAAAVTEVYKQILRGYIGTQNLENAQKAMAELEKIATGQGQDILPIYISLGKQFKEELDRLSKTNKQQYEGTLKSFESFLANMLSRKEGQNYNSLTWLGEMYIALGEGTVDTTSSGKYFGEGSKAFQEIVTKGQADTKFCSPQQILLAQSRLARCQRKAGQFEEAATLIQSLLQKNASQLDFQIEAAEIYRDWAASGRTDSEKQWGIALLGANAKGQLLVWGWGNIAKKIQNQIDLGQTSARYEEILIDARYNIAWCRHKAALNKPEKEKLNDLSRAEADIIQTVMQRDLNDEWYTKFNDLYKLNLQAMGRIPQDLEKNPDPIVSTESPADASPGDSNDSTSTASTKPKAKKKKKTAAKAPAPESSALLMFGGILGIGALGFGGWFLFGRKKPRSAVLAAAQAANPELEKAAKPAAEKPKSATKPAPKGKP